MVCFFIFFFFKQKTAYEIVSGDWSSDVCSSDLMGHLSPLDGIGPEQLGVRELEAILAQGGVRELILATNSTVEGEATAHFLGELAARRGIRASRIAHGVPVGGELEYVDGGTLAHALAGRQSVS